MGKNMPAQSRKEALDKSYFVEAGWCLLTGGQLAHEVAPADE
jgi:hypothetical protein